MCKAKQLVSRLYCHILDLAIVVFHQREHLVDDTRLRALVHSKEIIRSCLCAQVAQGHVSAK